MNNHRCSSRKWLFEAGDSLSTSIDISSSKFDQHRKSKSHLNRIIKKKRFNYQKYNSKPISIINWFYEFIKHIFIVYDESSSHDTTRSMMTYSTCQFEHVHKRTNNTIQSILESNNSNSASHLKMNSKLMVSAATSSSNLNTSPSIILCLSKSTQTEAYLSSSSLCINNEKFESCDPLRTNDIHSYSSSYQPTIASSYSKTTISLQTTQNFDKNLIISKIHRPSFALHDTRTCQFNKRNCLIGCYHSSQTEKNYRSNNHHYQTRTNINAPEIVFAENTCQLIKQAWLSSVHYQQTNFD